MSDVLRAVEEIVDVLCKHLGPQVLNQDTASDIDIDRHDDFRNEMQEVAADIVAIPTLRAALAPVTDEEVAGIRERHEALERLGELAHHDWASEAHTDRATLLRRDAQREAELVRLREALAFYANELNHIGHADPRAGVYLETSPVDTDGGQLARDALEPKP